jgi:hypothetical protein
MQTGYTFKNSHSGWEVIDSSGGFERCDNDGDRRHEVVGKGIIQVSLQ